MTLEGYYFIKDTKTGKFETGYGKYTTPMLYSKVSAASVAGRHNKQWNTPGRWVAVPVTVETKE